ncbi:MAG: hypothetical protein ACOYBC_04835 [Bilifractor sp.]|jgi:hypothetical protein
MYELDKKIRSMMKGATEGMAPRTVCKKKIDSQIIAMSAGLVPSPAKRQRTGRRWSPARIAATAAALTLICGSTVFAAGKISSLFMSSHEGYDYKSYEAMEEGAARAGISLELPETYENGYAFQGAVLTSNEYETEDGSRVKAGKGISADYGSDGDEVTIYATPASLSETSDEETASAEDDVVVTADGTKIRYRSDTCLFVPDGYTLTKEEKVRSETDPHFSVSYGSDKVETKVTDSAEFEKNGYVYDFQTDHTGTSRDTLIAMAEETASGR